METYYLPLPGGTSYAVLTIGIVTWPEIPAPSEPDRHTAPTPRQLDAIAAALAARSWTYHPPQP